MCGICGFVGNGNEAILLRMRDKMVHRGPDDSGNYLDAENKVGFGHRRLSIIDLSTRGRQPMISASGNSIISYNGEVYNFKEIKKELQQIGIVFRSKTDTEVILAAIEYWGVEAINKFRGMFAFAVWNKAKKELLLVRDRLGIKPLYYSITSTGTLVFASEIKALLEHPEISKNIDPQALDCYLKLDYIPAPKTIFKQIQKLLPAHYLIFGSERLSLKKYWSITFNPEERSVSCWLDELEAEFLVAVKTRMIADVPIGAFLSGGIDSSLTLTAMARLSAQPIKSFSIGFSDNKFDESQYAKLVADRNHTQSSYQLINSQLDFQLIKQLIYQADEPLADGSLIPTYWVCKAGKEGATVILSGDGGDETFIGYEKYERFFNSELKAKKFKIPQTSWLYNVLKKVPIGKRSLMLHYLTEPTHRYAELTYGYFSKDFHGIYDPKFGKHINIGDSLDWLSTTQALGTSSSLSTAQVVDYHSYLPDDILMKVDKMSMLNSLEVRVPFLDHKVQELAARIPESLKLHQGISKFILKELLKRWGYADDFIHRKKQGFAPSSRFWFTSENTEKIKDEVLNGRTAREGIFSRGALAKRFDNKDFNTIWKIWIFEQWYRQYFND